MPTFDNRSKLPLPLDTSPTGTCCICVPIPDDLQWKAAFLGNLYRLTLQINWERDTAHTAQIVAAKWKEVFDCVSETINMVDCCGGAGSVDIQQRILVNIRQSNRISIRQQLDVLQQTWIDNSLDVQLVFLDAPDEFDADPSDSVEQQVNRDLALCYACRALVDNMFNQLAEDYITYGTEALVAEAPFFFVPGLDIALALITVAGIFAAVEGIRVCNAADYRRWVACCIYQHLKGQDINDVDAFKGAFPDGDCGDAPDLGADLNVIRPLFDDWVRVQLSSEDNYLAFVQQLGAAFTLAEVTTLECDCDEFVWYHDWLNGTNDGSEFWMFHDIVAGKFPTFDDTNHWIESVDHQAPTGSTYVWMSWPVGTPFTLHRMKFTCTRAGQRSASDWFTLADNPTPQTLGGTGILNSIQVPDNLVTIDFDFAGGAGPVAVTDTLSLYAYMGISNTVEPDPARYMRITRIEIWGSGLDPFD